MNQSNELREEQAYTARVQQLLLALIEQARVISTDHLQSIQAIVADAWEDLRVKPTALSEEDLEQLSAEVDRFVVRRQFADSLAQRSERMLMNPFFARVDFAEGEDGEPEKIVIGLYSLKDEKGELLVHDWRAPVCSLYYDAMPGPAKYDSPSGEIAGNLTLKRQYRMENGRLLYFVDTSLSIDDSLLLDILSGATSRHMRQIVATIQAEQNAAIRQEDARVVSVVGSAGSGKTSVAMHRAAYLLYRRRDVLDASKIMILSPSTAFSEYVSGVLPQLGEENIRARTLREVVEGVLGRKVEKPYRQLEALLDAGGDLRRLWATRAALNSWGCWNATPTTLPPTAPSSGTFGWTSRCSSAGTSWRECTETSCTCSPRPRSCSEWPPRCRPGWRAGRRSCTGSTRRAIPESIASGSCGR